MKWSCLLTRRTVATTKAKALVVTHFNKLIKSSPGKNPQFSVACPLQKKSIPLEQFGINTWARILFFYSISCAVSLSEFCFEPSKRLGRVEEIDSATNLIEDCATMKTLLLLLLTFLSSHPMLPSCSETDDRHIPGGLSDLRYYHCFWRCNRSDDCLHFFTTDELQRCSRCCRIQIALLEVFRSKWGRGTSWIKIE
ncbi:hypothetical protein V6N12_071232 [Hibiscus sabdariffa]|uniref:Uncharacterized protein n=1 Tax=Hibiscus sabdariffa TaxID=183260 RepID=A0ABR2FJ53_9ROSI